MSVVLTLIRPGLFGGETDGHSSVKCPGGRHSTEVLIREGERLWGGGLSCIDSLSNILFSVASILLSSVGSCVAGGSFGAGGSFVAEDGFDGMSEESEPSDDNESSCGSTITPSELTDLAATGVLMSLELLYVRVSGFLISTEEASSRLEVVSCSGILGFLISTEEASAEVAVVGCLAVLGFLISTEEASSGVVVVGCLGIPGFLISTEEASSEAAVVGCPAVLGFLISTEEASSGVVVVGCRGFCISLVLLWDRVAEEPSSGVEVVCLGVLVTIGDLLSEVLPLDLPA